VELQLELIVQAIKRGDEGKDAALILICPAIPCILYMENRVGEKLRTMVLSLGAELFQQQQMHSLLQLHPASCE
jgi:hypothetical protein